MKQIIVVLVFLVYYAHAIKQLTSNDLYCDTCKNSIHSILSVRTADIFTEIPPYPDGMKHHLVSESSIRAFLLSLYDSATSANDKTKLLDAFNNYISNSIIQGKLSAFDNIDLDVLFSSITWCPGDVVPGPKDRANDPGDGFDTEIFDAIDNNTLKGYITKAVNTMSSGAFNDKLQFFTNWKNIVNSKPSVEWVKNKDGKWEVKKKESMLKKLIEKWEKFLSFN